MDVSKVVSLTQKAIHQERRDLGNTSSSVSVKSPGGLTMSK